MFRKVNEPKTSSIIIPSIVYEESRMDIKPYIDYKVEGYRIEYAALYTDRELSDLVNFTINWKNKAGFDNVKKIRITRKIGTTTIETIPINKNDDDGTEISKNKKYFTNFEESILSVEFKGVPSDFANDSNIFGENVFSIEYSIDGNNFNEISGLNTSEMKKGVSKEEVLLAVESNKFVTVQFNPKISQSGEIVKQFKNDKGYYFYPKQTGNLLYSVNSKLYGQIGVPLNIVIGTAGVGGVFLKKTTDDTFLNVDTNGNITSAVTGYEFNIIKVPGETEKIILGRYVTDSSNVKKIDKVLVIKDNNLKVIDFDDISSVDVYNSMFLTYNTTEQISRVPCTTTQVVAYNCSNTDPVPGLTNRRGREVTRVNITDKGIGDGQCNVNVRGVDFSLLDYANNNNISRESPTQYLVATNCGIDCAYEINDDVARPLCTSRSCFKTIDGDSVKKLGQGVGYDTLQGWNADGTQKVCPGTTQRVDCFSRGWLGPCDPCDPKLDDRVCDKVTTNSPVKRYIKTYAAETNNAKCEPTPDVKVNEWNASNDKKYETTENCEPSCTKPIWRARPSCTTSGDKITTWVNAALQRTGYPQCTNPSAPSDTSVTGGCIRCSSKSLNMKDSITQPQRDACDNLVGCTSQVGSSQTLSGLKKNLTCLGNFGYLKS